ncbi:MAG: divergent polysaccharide deacetylase family protein, partial [Methyloligellaceae bacterium]
LGPLPTIGKDGRHPWRVYARPFSGVDTRPRIAIVVTGLGISQNATEQAVNSLPGSVTLSFAPFTKKLTAWIDKSRASGHEVLIDLPMEPEDYPANDPGPHTLLASVPIDQNLRQLEWILSRATGYVGVSTFMGSGLSMKPRMLTPILTELKTRGLMLVDARENPLGQATSLSRDVGLTVVTNDIFIDQEPAGDSIRKRLSTLEDRAKRDGAAIGIARPYPVTIKQLTEWVSGLGAKGIALAPVSALAAVEKPRK